MRTLLRMTRGWPALGGLIIALTLYGAQPAPDAPPPQDQPADAPPAAQPEPEQERAPTEPVHADDDEEADMSAPPPAPADAAPDPETDSAQTPPDEPPPTPSGSEPTGPDRPTSASPQPAATPAGPSTRASDGAKQGEAAGAGADEAASPSATVPSEPVTPVPPGEKGLRLNFRGVPLELVLNYLSEAAGFIIVLETDVRGKVDVWSNQPLDQDEALTLLNTVLDKNGYAALRNGRLLTVISRDDAKKRDIPVISGSDPAQIPKRDEIVTQILPVRFINATQLAQDLAPLMPASATVTANQGGNALLITDTQTHIRRIAEIIRALDTSISSTYVIRVFALQYADAKSLATVIKEVFQTQETSSRSSDPRAQFFNRFGGGPGGMPGGQGGQGGGSGSSGGRSGASRVVATADERSNAVVVSAPEDVMQSVEGLVKAVDAPVEDFTEVRVFRLKFADPQEMADLLANLFPDTTTTQGSRGQMRFAGGRGGPGGFGLMLGGGSSTATSERQLKQTRVVAVADPRTGSVVVSASRDLMEQVAEMITQLDADPAKKQKVFVYDVENTDPQAVQEVLQSLFPEQNYGSSNMRRTSSTQRQNSNQLNTRQTQTRNTGSRSTSGFGSSSFGGSSGGR